MTEAYPRKKKNDGKFNGDTNHRKGRMSHLKSHSSGFLQHTRRASVRGEAKSRQKFSGRRAEQEPLEEPLKLATTIISRKMKEYLEKGRRKRKSPTIYKRKRAKRKACKGEDGGEGQRPGEKVRQKCFCWGKLLTKAWVIQLYIHEGGSDDYQWKRRNLKRPVARFLQGYTQEGHLRE